MLSPSPTLRSHYVKSRDYVHPETEKSPLDRAPTPPDVHFGHRLGDVMGYRLGLRYAVQDNIQEGDTKLFVTSTRE
jgi:hypothetical protein